MAPENNNGTAQERGRRVFLHCRRAVYRLGTYQRIIDASPAPERFYTYLKFIPKEDVHVFFSAADLVCLPYAAASQSGVTAIAMHYHKPAVATDVGGLKEYFMEIQSVTSVRRGMYML